ncbi:hypothetical protein POM88_051359 [Heracleum sosnowskyi]|uniref:Uncharacterized protein n=1 Tax=Heracleum sosnowskyi TaxID=360622 RepID=A0AAD8H0G7_9APIA|nr:hypothetical protein POM88_051359 [Heracleum sosnowskyi]
MELFLCGFTIKFGYLKLTFFLGIGDKDQIRIDSWRPLQLVPTLPSPVMFLTRNVTRSSVTNLFLECAHEQQNDFSVAAEEEPEEITLEATHHGPITSKPTLFTEIRHTVCPYLPQTAVVQDDLSSFMVQQCSGAIRVQPIREVVLTHIGCLYLGRFYDDIGIVLDNFPFTYQGICMRVARLSTGIADGNGSDYLSDLSQLLVLTTLSARFPGFCSSVQRALASDLVSYEKPDIGLLRLVNNLGKVSSYIRVELVGVELDAQVKRAMPVIDAGDYVSTESLICVTRSSVTNLFLECAHEQQNDFSVAAEEEPEELELGASSAITNENKKEEINKERKQEISL